VKNEQEYEHDYEAQWPSRQSKEKSSGRDWCKQISEFISECLLHTHDSTHVDNKLTRTKAQEEEEEKKGKLSV
jgi:hypothetical protein